MSHMSSGCGDGNIPTEPVITPTPNTPTTNVCVGVGVLVNHKEHPGLVLIGRRKGSHGSGSLALPGGHLEVNESVAQCAVREVEEECNLALDSTSVRLVGVTQDVFSESAGKHYVTLIVIAAVLSTSPLLKNMEPHKCEAWEWITLEALVQRRAECFLPLQHALDTFLMKPDILTQGLSGGLKMNENLRQ
ncbi:nudix hydrolase 1 [Nannochloropsis oceanica]